MNTEKEILENRGTIKVNTLRRQAVINLLTREGIVNEEELEAEVKQLMTSHYG